MKLFLRQLARKGLPIEIQDRSLDDDLDGDEIETFNTILGPVTALPCTPRGKAIFDGVSIDEDVTHEFHIVFDPTTINIENWVLFKGRRFRILDVLNCCESDDRLIISCTERGVITKEAANA